MSIFTLSTSFILLLTFCSMLVILKNLRDKCMNCPKAVRLEIRQTRSCAGKPSPAHIYPSGWEVDAPITSTEIAPLSVWPWSIAGVITPAYLTGIFCDFARIAGQGFVIIFHGQWVGELDPAAPSCNTLHLPPVVRLLLLYCNFLLLQVLSFTQHPHTDLLEPSQGMWYDMICCFAVAWVRKVYKRIDKM